jgi:hypothetical protein
MVSSGLLRRENLKSHKVYQIQPFPVLLKLPEVVNIYNSSKRAIWIIHFGAHSGSFYLIFKVCFILGNVLQILTKTLTSYTLKLV